MMQGDKTGWKWIREQEDAYSARIFLYYYSGQMWIVGTLPFIWEMKLKNWSNSTISSIRWNVWKLKGDPTSIPLSKSRTIYNLPSFLCSPVSSETDPRYAIFETI